MNTRKTSPLSPLWPTPSASLESAKRKIGSAAVQVCTERCANLENAARKLARDRGQTCTSESANLEKRPPMAGSAATDGADEKSFRKSALISKVDADACSSSTRKQEFEMSNETFKTIDNLVRKWSFAFNLDDHHAHKLRNMLERRAYRLTSAYERGRCGNFDAYIAVGLSKYAARDAARCKDQMSLHAEVSLDEPVNGEETDADTRLDFVADDGLAAIRRCRKRDVWEVVALLPRPYRRICEWIMAGRTEAQIAARLGVHRTSYKRTIFPKVRAAFIRLYGAED